MILFRRFDLTKISHKVDIETIVNKRSMGSSIFLASTFLVTLNLEKYKDKAKFHLKNTF